MSNLIKILDNTSFYDSEINNEIILNDNFIEDLTDTIVLDHAVELMSTRFRGFYPIIIDIETSGLDYKNNAILQLAAISLTFDNDGKLIPFKKLFLNLHPISGNILDKSSLKFINIDPFDQSRKAINLHKGLKEFCTFVRKLQKMHKCSRSVLVAHNSVFDSSFIYHNIEKMKIKRSPFHPFISFDTSSIAAIFFGETRLREIIKIMGNDFDDKRAHNALYDAEKCAEIFIHAVNKININNNF